MSQGQRRIGAGPAAAAPRNVGEARAAVADSRARISATIDELEERIVDKKEALRDRLDVARPVRVLVSSAPLVAIVAAVGAGLLFGLATGGRRKRPELTLTDVDADTLQRWRRERRQRLLNTADRELPRFEPPPSRLGRLVRDLAHEFAGAATALVAAQLVDRVKDERD